MIDNPDKLRLAYFSPLRPQRSGIADYSEDLLPYLAAEADVTLVVGPGPRSGPLAQALPAIGTEEFLRTASSFDLPIYQVGNSVDHHGYMLDCLHRVPGIVVLHDYCLHYLMLGLTLFRGDLGRLESILGATYGPRGPRLARRLLFCLQDPFQLSFAGQLVARSRAVVVHSLCAEQLVRKDFPEKRVQVIPMGVPLDLPGASRSELKARQGFREGDLVVASINSPAYNKRLSLVLEALRGAHARFPQLRLVILSGRHFDARTSELLQDPALRDAVTCPGWLSAEQYREFIHLADVVVDMRYPSGAETSASVSRAMAFGKAMVVSAQGTFHELPDGACVKVPVGGDEVARLTEALCGLAADPGRVDRMGRAARQYAVANLGLQMAARRYAGLARQVVGLALPAGSWTAPPQPAALKRMLISTTYKTFRTLSFLRTYGVVETIERVRKELSRQGEAQPADLGTVR